MSDAKPPRFGRGTAILSLMGTGGLAFFAVTRPWWHASIVTAGMPKTEVSVTGSSVVPLAVGAALLIVAASLGIIAGATGIRRGLGILVVAVAAGAILAMITTSAQQAQQTALDAAAVSGVDVDWSQTAWRFVALASFVTAGVCGILATIKAQHWATMSARFDAPQPLREVDSADTWKMIDQGIDPTEESAQ